MRRSAPLAAVAVGFLILVGGAHAAPPPNNSFANAEEIKAPPTQAVGDNTEATTQTNEPEGHGTRSIWFKWAADAPGRFRVDVCDTLPAADLRLGVYTGGTVSTLTNVAAAGTNGVEAPLAYGRGGCADSRHPALVFDAVVGTTYYIAVGSDSCCDPTTSTNIVVKLRKSEANDNFSEAAALGPLPAEAPGSSLFASREQSEPEAHGEASVWWRWTPDQPGRYRADVCATLPAADLRMGVYTGSSVSALTNVAAAGTNGVDAPLAYGRGACGDARHPALVFDAAVGQTYYIAVGADSCCDPTTSPNVVLKLQKSALNDNLAEALELPATPARATGSSVFASLEQFEPTAHGEASIWWRWTAPRDGPYAVHTCKTQPDAGTQVRVYQGEAVSALSAVEARVTACGGTKRGERARFEAVAGQSYLFAVGADSCCDPTVSPGVVLVLRDTDCDAAKGALKKARNRVAKLTKALKRARSRGQRGKARSLGRKLRNARGKVNRVKERRAAAC